VCGASVTGPSWNNFAARATNRVRPVGRPSYSVPEPAAEPGFFFLGLTGRDVFRVAFERLPVPVRGLALGLAATAILKLGPDGVLPFIYFQF